jgi:hypothetical protein
VHKFADALHWLRYWPPLAVEDLDSFGLCCDWRRSFITTHVNRYYDAFIRWQFNTLRRKGKVKFGARSAAQTPSPQQQQQSDDETHRQTRMMTHQHYNGSFGAHAAVQPHTTSHTQLTHPSTSCPLSLLSVLQSVRLLSHRQPDLRRPRPCRR